MKIGLITHTFIEEHFGGREKHVESLAKALGDIDEVIVFTGSNTKKVVKEKKDNYTLYRIPSISITLSRNPLQIYRFVPGLFNILSKEKFDILHAHEYGHFTTDISALYSRIYNIPFVLTIHGYIINSKLKLLKNIYDMSIGKFELKTARKIIVTSNSLRDEIIDCYNIHHIETIPNGIFVDEYKHENSNKQDIITSIGRMIPRKGFTYLIDAAENILKDYPNIKFLLIGPNGGDEHNIIKKINKYNLGEKVILLNNIPDNMLKDILFSSRIFAIPSLYEPFGIVALEAMASGCPIIATKIGGLSEIIDHNETGLLISPANSRELADSIRILLDDNRTSERLINNAREKVKDFDWSNIAIRTRHLYKDILNSH